MQKESPALRGASDAAAGLSFRAAMRRVASTVTVVTTGGPFSRHGMTATAVTSVSADPPSLLVCINQGAGTVGFDCSGLMLYMFAGIGIKLDHYTGSQYNAGRKVPSSQMRRGDMIFYGPNASQHVAMYLGGGQMLEAPYTGSVVKVSPVRTSGMTPYATRLIEW